MRIEALTGVQSPIGLEEFVRAAEGFDPRDRESIWSMRGPLAALALNREWIFSGIAEALRARLRSPWAREQPSYFILHPCADYCLRANIWLPERVGDGPTVLENAAFSYDFPHDHNFDILTATCFGTGYETDIYSYDEIGSNVAVGDVVAVEPLGRLRLSPGTVFLYEACRDVHTQLPVDDITMTLNFLPLRPEDHARPQLIFEVLDDRRLMVSGVPLSPEGREMSAIRMLTKMCSAERAGRRGLEAIAAEHGNGRVRAYAGRSLEMLAGRPSELQAALLHEIDRDNVAFKYHEIAEISRARTATA